LGCISCCKNAAEIGLMNVQRAVQDVRTGSSERGVNIHAECVRMAACVIHNKPHVNARQAGLGLHAASHAPRSVHSRNLWSELVCQSHDYRYVNK